MRYIALCLLLSGLLTLQSPAQSLLKNGEVPDDLLITLKRSEGGGTWNYSEMTINAAGDISYLYRGGLPLSTRFPYYSELHQKKSPTRSQNPR